MNLEFENRIDPQWDYLEEDYKRLMEIGFSMLSVPENYEIDVSLVGDEEIHEINRDYRSVDRVTDVISFAFDDDKTETGRIVNDLSIPHMLGEIFICVVQALCHAAGVGRSWGRGLFLRFVDEELYFAG